jgi:uncharacterized protein (DUF934 family)
LPLLDRQGLRPDAYRRDAAADAAIVPLDALEAALAGRRPEQRIGVDLPNDVHPDRLRPFLRRLDLIAIAFPRFSDGRGFSLGRMLREMGYAGTLRATGWIIPDQFGFALRCGFDEVEIDDEQAVRQPTDQWQAAPGRFSAFYQAPDDGAASIFERRRAARTAA